MKPGDRFIISYQIGNVILHKPSDNQAKVIAFVGTDVLFQIGTQQYILPIDVFKQFIIKKVKKENVKSVNRAEFEIFTMSETKTSKITNNSNNNSQSNASNNQSISDSSTVQTDDDKTDNQESNSNKDNLEVNNENTIDDLYSDDDLYEE